MTKIIWKGGSKIIIDDTELRLDDAERLSEFIYVEKFKNRIRIPTHKLSVIYKLSDDHRIDIDDVIDDRIIVYDDDPDFQLMIDMIENGCEIWHDGNRLEQKTLKPECDMFKRYNYLAFNEMLSGIEYGDERYKFNAVTKMGIDDLNIIRKTFEIYTPKGVLGDNIYVHMYEIEKSMETCECKKKDDNEKIPDIEKYDPDPATNEQLRDDWRLTVSWYSDALDPEKEMWYTQEEILVLGEKIIKELINRKREGEIKFRIIPDKNESYENFCDKLSKRLSENEKKILEG